MTKKLNQSVKAQLRLEESLKRAVHVVAKRHHKTFSALTRESYLSNGEIAAEFERLNKKGGRKR